MFLTPHDDKQLSNNSHNFFFLYEVVLHNEVTLLDGTYGLDPTRYYKLLYLCDDFLGCREFDHDIGTLRGEPNSATGLGETPEDGQREDEVRAAGADSRRHVQVEDHIRRHLQL